MGRPRAAVPRVRTPDREKIGQLPYDLRGMLHCRGEAKNLSALICPRCKTSDVVRGRGNRYCAACKVIMQLRRRELPVRICPDCEETRLLYRQKKCGECERLRVRMKHRMPYRNSVNAPTAQSSFPAFAEAIRQERTGLEDVAPHLPGMPRWGEDRDPNRP